MSGLTALAVLAGGVLGFGLWLVYVRLPAMRRTTFTERVAPQLRSLDASSRLLREATSPVVPFGPLERIAQPLLREAVTWLSRFNVGSAALAKRLAEAGLVKTPFDFRAEQLVWSGVGFAGSTATVVWLGLSGRINILAGLLMILASTAAGFMVRDYVLSSAIQRRRQRILAEFPAVADMMALAVGAGETAAGALDRTSRLTHGALAEEFRRALADVRSGTPLARALHGMADRVGLSPITRFVDGLVVAVERGTPLADVLRAQAQDVRDLAKRELMEAAGRKEIGMMAPLVFGILPLTVLFAVFPGIAAITIAT
ncbi:type II secretion system F family protein [Sinomonas sp. ASV322]|uniref:type II secretion system F family protein n=1 Tax=Sinomonas sp. ASV322 TaxID=3041920 RepID=UPI0027DC359E|nr:type II secretion system F family protein [Sinomonas sp. ASV322]MDQ4503231.1 type II secretion system F family protein [Sinomonas sp. ASV322]